MTAQTSIDDAVWLRAPQTVKLLSAFQDAPGALRFVGGCVRNTLLGEPVCDIDLATVLEPNQVIAKLDTAGLRAVPTGIDHGTVTAVVDHHPFEITTLRADVSTDGRRATVAFTTDWRADAARRDFTMNAIYADPDGTLFDPLEGMSDLLARRVKFIGDANRRLREDYLRILRFFRFGAEYGAGEVDEAGLQACIANADGLNQLSGERIQSEFLKLLSAPWVLPIVKLMTDAKILSKLLPGPVAWDRFTSLVQIERAEGRAADPLLRLGALLSSQDGILDALVERMKLSNAAKSRLAQLLVKPAAVNVYADEADLKRQFYPLTAEAAADLVLLGWAADQKGDHGAYRRALAIADTWERPRFPLTGTDVLDLGVPAGSEVGEILEAMKTWWIYQNFAPGRDELLAEVRRYVSDL